jgi:peptidylprolyl isomerase domain and WD repeat-containing protein 1
VRTAPVTAEQLRVYAEALPCALHYERSYLHRDVVTHVAVAPDTDFLLTASADGCLKFWRKTASGVMFVKTYRAHLGEIAALAVSPEGARAATAGDDGTLKLFDVASFDMQTMAKLDFLPSGAAAWCYPRGAPLHALALADRHAPLVHVLDGGTGAPLPWGRVALHTAPVLAMAYCAARDVLVSGDARGVLECWSACPERALQPPAGVLAFAAKVDTDLFALAREMPHDAGEQRRFAAEQMCDAAGIQAQPVFVASNRRRPA